MPWTAGQRLQGGKYVIGEVLGQGGFGITYKALHVELNRQVVIKTPNEYLSRDPEYDKYIKRFIQEGQILARLSEHLNSHIVGVIELFQESSTHCLVMDFVPGENLFQAVKRRGALPEAEIVPCIRQIGEALTVVHQAGLVHRDAHPGNIMLRSNGKAVLIDFGIAKELLPKTLSSTGNAGNHGFAPYEQIHRGSREPTVDVYCLAATLYYAVTGQNPTTSLARKLDDTLLTPPKRIIPRISDQLNQAIIKGMALEAKDRPQSIQAWLAMLEAPKATPPPPVEPVHIKEVVRPKAKSESDATPDKPAIKPTKTIPRAKPTKAITWGWLFSLWMSYGLIGYILAVYHAPLSAVAVAMAGGVAVAMAEVMLGSSAWVVTFPLAGAVAGALVGAWAVGWVVAWVSVLTWVIVGFVAVFMAGVVIMVVYRVVPVPVVIVVVVIMVVAVVMPGVVTLAVSRAKVVTLTVALVGAGVGAGVGGFILAILGMSKRELQKSFTKFHTFLILAGISAIGLNLGWLGRWFLTQDYSLLKL